MINNYNDPQFQVVLRLRNTTDRKYNLHLTLRQLPDSGLVWVGDIKKVVGEVPPCSHLDVNLVSSPFKPSFTRFEERESFILLITDTLCRNSAY